MLLIRFACWQVKAKCEEVDRSKICIYFTLSYLVFVAFIIYIWTLMLEFYVVGDSSSKGIVRRKKGQKQESNEQRTICDIA